MSRPEVAALHRALEDQGYYVTPIGDAVKVHERGEEGPILHLAPLVEAVLAAQWRPIETAPKDGTDILGWWPHDGMHVVFWSSDGWGTCMTKGEWTPPVMWQHLPPPPKDPPTPA